MARTREFDPQDVLIAAVQVFWKRGYADTSMRDIVKASGVAHAGIYAEFGGKRELYLRVLEQYEKRFGEIAVRKLESEDSDLDSIRNFFYVVSEGVEDGRFANGCLIGNTVVEFGDGSPDIVSMSRRFIERLTSAFEVALGHGQAKGQVDSTRDAGEDAQYLTTSFYGAMTMVRAKVEPEKVRRGLEQVLAIFG